MYFVFIFWNICIIILDQNEWTKLQIQFIHSDQERLDLQKTWFVQALYAESVKRFKKRQLI